MRKRILYFLFTLCLGLLFVGTVNAKDYITGLTEGTVITNDKTVFFNDHYYIAYYDKNGDLLDVFAMPNSYYYDSYGFKVGQSCREIAMYNGSSEVYADERCTTESMLIYSSGVDYSNIKMWEVISNTNDSLEGSGGYWSYDTTNEYCSLYEGTDKELPLLCDLLAGWGSDDQSYRNDYADYQLIKFQEYDTSETVKFEWVCTPKEVQKDDIVICDLKVKSVETLLDFKFNLKNDLFEVKNVTGKEDWNVEVKGNSYNFQHEGFLGNSTVATFKIIIKETNDKKDVDIPIEELSFNTKSGYKDVVSLTDKVKVKEVVNNNPGTSDINVVIIVTISLISLIIFVGVLNHKKKLV